VTALEELSRDALRSILLEPRNALVRQYQKLFEIEGVELVFEDDAIEAIIDVAQEYGTGARALRRSVEKVMTDIMFDIPSRKNLKICTISAGVVKENKSPKFKLSK